ncbi:D-alanine--D-alanine ligase [Nocardioides perillae]|uniref:D-alanine--D-alanine ligase n=1 Tax=Nocardioides perillae TaxID=1119534 RepID=A0A7Y9RYG4_9ACTN|nr:D-alanine-D-alanine ligase [Nocardioides perillae]
MNEPSAHPGPVTGGEPDDPAGRARPRVAVVFGGRSSEHGISCVTAGSVLSALDRARWDVVPLGIATDGRWVLETDDPSRLALGDDGSLPAVDPTRPAVALAPLAGGAALVLTEDPEGPRSLGPVDVVLPLLHGPYGEDGTLQGLLEMVGLRYVGAGVLASAVSMDKASMKVVLAAAGLPVLPSRTVTARAWADDAAGCASRAEALGLPVFVKPLRGGSSIGISKVTAWTDLTAAVDEALRHDTAALVEAGAVDAREVECGVLEDADGALRTSVPAEIRVGEGHDFYDFEAKYLPGQATEVDLPADLDDVVVARLQALAVRTFEAVGCSGLARVDFFVLPGGELVVNEINTMPGFTPTSMFPQVWAASGVDYPALVDHLVTVALERAPGLR